MFNVLWNASAINNLGSSAISNNICYHYLCYRATELGLQCGVWEPRWYCSHPLGDPRRTQLCQHTSTTVQSGQRSVGQSAYWSHSLWPKYDTSTVIHGSHPSKNMKRKTDCFFTYFPCGVAVNYNTSFSGSTYIVNSNLVIS